VTGRPVPQFADDLDIAKAAARRAGAVIMRHFRTTMEVRHKSPGQPLTAADLEADALLREALTGARPGYGWLSEETRDTPDRLARSRVWIVDPIDGTRSFVAGRAEFAVSVGLAEAGSVVLGVVYNPSTDELYEATLGGGAFLVVGGERRRLRVNGGGGGVRARLLASRSEIGTGALAPFATGFAVEPVGSTAYKLARVAAGQGDVFLSLGPKNEWDVCAGALLVSEAGGRMTDLRGATPRYNRRDTSLRGVIAAGAELHARVLDAVLARPAEEEE
jgi:myo-inositol-1(or 4)-monophosphatase